MSPENKNHTEGYVTSRVDYDGRNGPLIDLGLGKSPIGGASELRQLLASRDPFADLADYDPDPNHTQTRKLIIEGIGLKNIGPESVVLNGNGSYGAGDEVIRYLALSGYRRILVPVYSFPNVAQWALRHGISYEPVINSEKPLDPQASLKKILLMDPSEIRHSIVYLDYPNNPFGNRNPELMAETIPHITKNGGAFILDLAFGEVLGEEYRLAQQYALDNAAICLGSLTKTQGFARLRTGWSILPDSLSHNGFTGPQRLVFGLNNEADFVCQQLFTQQGDTNLAKIHASRVTTYNRETNSDLYIRLQSLGLTVHPTLSETSIQVVTGPVSDFYHRLMHQGIKTESLSDYSETLAGYDGYGDQAVRLLTPGPDRIDEVIRRIKLSLL